MGTQTLLEMLKEYLDMGASKRRKKYDDIKKVIKALKSKEKKLIAKRQDETSTRKKKMLAREIAVLHEKRNKGLKALKKLRKE